MAARSAIKRRAKKSAAKTAATRGRIVEITKPSSPEESEKVLGIGVQRSQKIKRLVDEATA